MTRHNKDRRKKLLTTSASVRDLDHLLDILLALDRSVIELSMHVYNVPPRHQLAMREQNRCLHEAVRKRLPRSMSKHASIGQP